MNHKLSRPRPWPRSVVIVESPSANLKSIYIAIQRLQAEGGFSLKLSRDPATILAAERVIFPGVGHAQYILNELQNSGLDDVLRQVQSPLLGICLGMQLLFEQLSEGGPCPGLGLLPGEILPLRPALDTSYSVPHIGWNPILPYPAQNDSCALLFSSAASQAAGRPNSASYFVHSYYLPPGRTTVASCRYGPLEISAIVRGQGTRSHIWGCQFHPEKSGRFGAEILRRWLQNAGSN